MLLELVSPASGYGTVGILDDVQHLVGKQRVRERVVGALMVASGFLA